MQSDLFKLKIQDFVRGAVNAVIGAVVIAVAGLFGEGFNVFTADWANILNMVLNVAGATFMSYLSTKFLTDSEGTIHLGFAKVKKS